MEGHLAKRERHTALGERLDRRLLSYAAAASAGAGLLGVARPAEAHVVYTPTRVQIGYLGSYALDLTNNGTTDFTIRNSTLANCSTLFSSLLAFPVLGNAVAGGHFRDRSLAAALRADASIGPKQNFVRQYPLQGAVIDSPGGPQYLGGWTDVVNRYLGLKFQINGETHFGWALLSVHLQMNQRVKALLTGYAYETQPDTPIYAGQTTDGAAQSRLLPSNGSPKETLRVEPATLGALALGSLGLNAWRGKETLETDTHE